MSFPFVKSEKVACLSFSSLLLKNANHKEEAIMKSFLFLIAYNFAGEKLEIPKFHYLSSIPPTEKKERPTKPCPMCRKIGKRRETRYYCPECVEKPALCIENCFKLYHLQKLNLN